MTRKQAPRPAVCGAGIPPMAAVNGPPECPFGVSCIGLTQDAFVSHGTATARRCPHRTTRVAWT